MKEFPHLKEGRLATVVKVILVIACAMVPIAWLGSLAQAEVMKPKLVYQFAVTNWNETAFAGIPFYVKCEKENVDQWFELRGRTEDYKELPKATGFLQAYNIVWMGWGQQEFKIPAKQTVKFELWTKGPDQIGVTEVSFISDEMFRWKGDTPINPPEE